jgi:hypothetical protein
VSYFVVYNHEVPNTRFSDRDVERLLSGLTPEDDALAIFAPLMEALQTEWSQPPTPESVASFAAAAAQITSMTLPEESRPRATGALSRQPRKRRPSISRRLAIPVLALLVLSGMTGVAIAADRASPGEALYGIDLALEDIGVGRGGVVERLTESSALAEQGNAAEALAHAAQSVAKEVESEEDVSAALEGLEQAIAELSGEAPGHSSEIRASVAAMLQWMLDNAGMIGNPDFEPGAFGRGVAGMAGQISHGDDGDDEPGSGDGPPSGSPGGPPDGVPPADA